MNSLNAKQQRFVGEYLIDLNATAAYKRAGYSGKGRSAENAASRLLGNVGVAQAIQQAMEKRSKDLGIDAKYVLMTIVETIERCKQAKPVTYKNGEPVLVETPNGEVAPAYAFDAAAVLKGAELLGKHLKMFTDKTELSGAGGGPVAVKADVTVSPEDAYLRMIGK
jgi:phage terminase small subunit